MHIISYTVLALQCFVLSRSHVLGGYLGLSILLQCVERDTSDLLNTSFGKEHISTLTDTLVFIKMHRNYHQGSI